MSDIERVAREQLFASFQYEIYARGLGGERPQLPISVVELEERAREHLSAEAFGYVAGGAGAEGTVRANLLAFERWRIVPRMLRDVSTATSAPPSWARRCRRR